MFKYTNKYFRRFGSPKPFFVGCNNHLIWHGWCAWTSLYLVVSTASPSNAATQIFLLPWQAASSSSKWDAACYLYHCFIVVTLVVPLSTAVLKWFSAVLLLTKTAIGYAAKPSVVYVKVHWGSKISSFCCLDIEGHDCNTLTSPPMSSVVGHSIFLSPLLDVPLGEGSSSICSSKVSDNSNMLLSNIDSYVTSALAKYVYETTLINSEMFPYSSDTYEEFYLLKVGNVIEKQYLYDECKSIAHHIGF